MLPDRMRTYGWRTYGDAIRELVLGAMAGILVLVIEQGAREAMPTMGAVTRSAILGMFIIAGARAIETALSWAIEQSGIPTVFRTIVYAVGGWLGYLAGGMVVWMLVGPAERDLDATGPQFFYVVALSAFISILIGLILHHNRKRNDRLRSSIERLKEHEFAEKELELARSMQQRLLPPADIEGDGYRVTARTEAAHIVGGDFYDVIRLDDGAVAVLAADVSGKGMAASLLMASCKASVPFLASKGGAAAVMTALNATLCAQLQRREFVAMVFCRYEPETGTVDIVNAGMPDPIAIDRNGVMRTIGFEGERLPLGAMKNVRYESARTMLAKGERLLLFSDGLPEAISGDGPIGYGRVESLVRASSTVDEIVQRLRAGGDVRVEDDLTLVMLERRDRRPSP